MLSLSCSMTLAAFLPAGVTTAPEALVWLDAEALGVGGGFSPATIEAAMQLEAVSSICENVSRAAKTHAECLNEEDHAYVQCEIALALREGAEEAQASREYEAHFYA